MYSLPPSTYTSHGPFVTPPFVPMFISEYTSKSSLTCVASECLQCLKRPQKEKAHICRQVDSQCGLLVCEGATVLGLGTPWRALPPREMCSHSLSPNPCAAAFPPHFV